MDLQRIIKDQITGAVLDKIAHKTGLDKKTTDNVIETALPTILEGLKKNTSKQKGAEELDKTLEKNHDGSILDNLLENVTKTATKKDGGKILDHIFGSKTKNVNDEVSKKTGADSSAVTDILSTLGPIVLGQLGKTKKEQGLDSGELGELLGKQKLNDKNGILSTLNTLLDRDKDGSAIDDILETAQNFFGKKI